MAHSAKAPVPAGAGPSSGGTAQSGALAGEDLRAVMSESEAADYIRDMTVSLTSMAASRQFSFLAYLLEMSALEADRLVRELKTAARRSS